MYSVAIIGQSLDKCNVKFKFKTKHYLTSEISYFVLINEIISAYFIYICYTTDYFRLLLHKKY